jgi:YVTN family beta-propeller protein
MKKLNFAVVLLYTFIISLSCEKNNNPEETSGYKNGIFIVNEGSYNSNNGSISFMDASNSIIVNDIFYTANGRSLGDIVQSFSVLNDSLGVIVVNHSAKLEIVRLSTFQAITEPLPVSYPRYFLPVTEMKGYVTSGSLAGKIYVLDLSSMTISDSIGVGFGPEVLLRLNNYVYVANSGGWGNDSTISVINTLTDHVFDTLFVGNVPSDLAFDEESYLWVYCKGFTNYIDIETDSYLQKIDPLTNSIIWQGKVGSAQDYLSVPAKLAISDDGTKLYYLRPDGVYQLDTSDPSIAEGPLIPGNYYGLDVNPENNRIFVFEATFTGNGTVKIFEPDGALFGQGAVGVGPNGAVFNLQ